MNFIDRISKDVRITNFMKIRAVGAELLFVDRWTNRPPGGRTETRICLKSLFTIPRTLLKDSELGREWHSMQTKPRSSLLSKFMPFSRYTPKWNLIYILLYADFQGTLKCSTSLADVTHRISPNRQYMWKIKFTYPTN